MARHIEIHYLDTNRDAAYLATAGFPRYDLEPVRCNGCNQPVGEVHNHQDEPVAWRAFGVVLDGDRIGVACKRCLSKVDAALAAC